MRNHEIQKQTESLADIAEKLGVAGMALLIFQKAGGNILQIADAGRESFYFALSLLVLSFIITLED